MNLATLKELQGRFNKAQIMGVLPIHHAEFIKRLNGYITNFKGDNTTVTIITSEDDMDEDMDMAPYMPDPPEPSIACINVCGEILQGTCLTEDECSDLGICDLD